MARFASFEPVDGFGPWPIWPVCGPFVPLASWRVCPLRHDGFDGFTAGLDD